MYTMFSYRSVGQEQEESMVADETDQHHEDFQGFVNIWGICVKILFVLF